MPVAFCALELTDEVWLSGILQRNAGERRSGSVENQGAERQNCRLNDFRLKRSRQRLFATATESR